MHIYTSIVRDGEWTLRIALLVSLLTATYYSVPVTTSASRRVYWMSLSSEQRRQRHQPGIRTGRDHENTTASSRGHKHWVQTSFVRSHDTFTASFSEIHERLVWIWHCKRDVSLPLHWLSKPCLTRVECLLQHFMNYSPIHRYSLSNCTITNP